MELGEGGPEPLPDFRGSGRAGEEGGRNFGYYQGPLPGLLPMHGARKWPLGVPLSGGYPAHAPPQPWTLFRDSVLRPRLAKSNGG